MKIQIETDCFGQMTSASRHKMQSLLGSRLAAIALPKIEQEIKARHPAPPLAVVSGYAPETFRRILSLKKTI